MTIDEKRLMQTLGRPELKRILARIRHRLVHLDPSAHPEDQAAPGRLVIKDASDQERDALGRLLGRNFEGKPSISFQLADLEAILRAGEIAGNLAQAVSSLTGPLVNPKSLRRRKDQAWSALFSAAKAKDPRREIAIWLDDLKKSGLLRRLSSGQEDAQSLLEQSLTVAGHLPAENLLTKELAALTLGDAHALDGETRLNTLLLRFAALLGQDPEPAPKPTARDLWEQAGLINDDLSSSVLLLGLRSTTENFTGQMLDACAEAGEPYRISLHQLKRFPLPPIQHEKVFICENPAVVQAAALRLQPGHHPILCLEGQPSTAAQRLLEQLRQQGAALYYHGDFDWPGITIANGVISNFKAHPWQMSSQDYLRAPAKLPLSGGAVTPRWDPQLAQAMSRRHLAVHEEAVIPLLLADLAAAKQKG